MPDFECGCQASACRGTVRGTDYLQPFVDEYGEHVSDYVARARRARGRPEPDLRVVAED